MLSAHSVRRLASRPSTRTPGRSLATSHRDQSLAPLLLPMIAERFDTEVRQAQRSPGLACLDVAARSLGAPDIDREHVVVEPGIRYRPPLIVLHPRHDMVPSDGPDLLSAEALQQRECDVAVPPAALCCLQQCLSLYQGQALRRPPGPAAWCFDQLSDVPADALVHLGEPDRTLKSVPGDLKASSRQLPGQG